MNDEDKIRIAACFHKWATKDPYPLITEWQFHVSMLSKLSKFFGGLKKFGPKPEISAHKAWLDGYSFAKNLVMEELMRPESAAKKKPPLIFIPSYKGEDEIN